MAVWVCSGGLGLLGTADVALAWGASGHRLIGESAARALPPELPAFLRRADAVRNLGELAREADRSKGIGQPHDSDRDPAHYVSLDEAGKVVGGPHILDLPSTRADFEKALQPTGFSSWQGGYLPYAIQDRWQQLVRELAHWRVADHGARHQTNRAERAWFVRDRLRREAVIQTTLGDLAHFVGDGSQPLHVSIHHNGWSTAENPEGFTRERIHAPFEGAFVRNRVSLEQIEAQMRPFSDCGCPVATRSARYLAASHAQVVPLYRLWKAGGFGDGASEGTVFAAERLAAGSSELRDLIVLAWRASATSSVGWPALKVDDILQGRVDPFGSQFGKD